MFVGFITEADVYIYLLHVEVQFPQFVHELHYSEVPLHIEHVIIYIRYYVIIVLDVISIIVHLTLNSLAL